MAPPIHGGHSQNPSCVFASQRKDWPTAGRNHLGSMDGNEGFA